MNYHRPLFISSLYGIISLKAETSHFQLILVSANLMLAECAG